MDIQESINNVSYAYSVSLLKSLLNMGLITHEEFNRISSISAYHYDTDIFCV